MSYSYTTTNRYQNTPLSLTTVPLSNPVFLSHYKPTAYRSGAEYQTSSDEWLKRMKSSQHPPPRSVASIRWYYFQLYANTTLKIFKTFFFLEKDKEISL